MSLMSGEDYSSQEMMIIAASREINDGEVVFVGMRLPMMAFAVARLTHAPNAVGLFECGIARYEPADDILHTMADPANQKNAAWATGVFQIMGQLQGGRADVGFIGGAEIDRYGNVNTSYIGGHKRMKVKLPGSGGAADIAAMAKRLLVIMNHDPHRFVERVSYITSPGYLRGGESRREAGLPSGGPSAVITNCAILRPHGPDRELHLASTHGGCSVDDVLARTGWKLKVAPDAGETPPPSAAELAALHRVDKEGFWRS
jgi:glutaconate CoA-transferase subunit B